MYAEGYVWEGLIEHRGDGAGSDSTVVSEEVHQSGGTTITERKHRQVFSGEPGEMSAFGITETTI